MRWFLGRTPSRRNGMHAPAPSSLDLVQEPSPFLVVALRVRRHISSIMASTAHTAIAPSFGGGGGGGKRGRGDGDDGRDRRRPDKPKPTDKLSAADFAPNGRIRLLLLLLLQTANLGDLPGGGLLTRGGQAKTVDERTSTVRRWVEGHLHASSGLMQARYTELAEAFVHIVRAVNEAGLFDQLVAMLVVLLTNRAVDRHAGDDEQM